MGRKLALLIANSVYDDKTLTKLVTPEADVDMLEKVLGDKDIGGFDEVKTLKNEPARSIKIEIAHFFADKKRDELLLLYFSGHGILDNRGNLYLAGRDTDHDHELIDATAISSIFINDRMVGSSSKQKVLILDCCYSGAFTRGSKGVTGRTVNTAKQFNGRGQVILTATDATQYALEGDSVTGKAPKSVFTRYLVEGLETGEADRNKDGWITLDEWYEYTYEQVTKETNAKQTPSKWASQQGSLPPIAKSPLPIPPQTSPPLPPTLRQPKHPRSLYVVGVFILLILLGGGYFAVTGHLPWSVLPGQTWHVQNFGPPASLTGVAWSGSQFVVVGYYGTILTSPNGSTWIIQTSGTLQDLTSITWSGSQLVAVGGNSTILTSP